MKTPADKRFMQKVAREGGHWRFRTGPKGFFRVTTGQRDLAVNAKLAAWLIFRGDVPKNRCVMSCSEPWCVNPFHLELGTMSAVVKRRPPGSWPRGEYSPSARLTEKQALAILKAVDEGWLHRQLAFKYGVSEATINHLVSGRNWKHLRRA